jgi:hypothetical protein
MLPLVCVFAIPVATSLAVGFTVGSIFSRGESVLFHFFPLARQKLELSVFIFSIAILIIYIPFVFWWAPQGYWSGKQFLFRAAQQQIENLPAQKFHRITSRATIFFKSKSGNPARFNDILLMVGGTAPQVRKYFITAQTGILTNGILNLSNGTIYTAVPHEGIATFKFLEVAFEKIFFSQNTAAKKVKFLSWEELTKERANLDVWKELHKRIAQIIWQLLLPFLIFWGMMFLSKPKSNILLSGVLSGGLFLASYISLNTAYYLLDGSLSKLIIFYLIPIAAASIFYFKFRKLWPE